MDKALGMAGGDEQVGTKKKWRKKSSGGTAGIQSPCCGELGLAAFNNDLSPKAKNLDLNNQR